MPGRHDRRDNLRPDPPGLVWRRLRHRDKHVQAVGARRLRHAHGADLRQLVAQPACDVEHRLERRAGIGSRSKAIWSVRCSDCMRENHGSCEMAASCVRYSSVLSVPPTGRLGTSSSGSTSMRTPAGTLVGRAMLVKRLAAHAVWIALHDQGTVRHHRQDERRDLHVVPHQVALGETLAGPEDLVEVADLERVAIGQRERGLGLAIGFDRWSWSMTEIKCRSAGVPVCRGARVLTC